MGALHAITLLTCVALTELACRRYRRSPSTGRIIGALVAGLGLALFSAGLGVHQCDRGIPVQQWAIPSICLVIGLGLIGHDAIRRWLAATLVMISIVGTLHYAAVVHGGTYVGHDQPVHVDETASLAGRPRWHTPLSGLYTFD